MSKANKSKDEIVAYYSELIDAKDKRIKTLKDENIILTKTLLKNEEKLQKMSEELALARKDV